MKNTDFRPYDAALYIHIPYCVQKCDYCDFYSSCDMSSSESLLAEIPKQAAALSELYSIKSYTSVYLGGGTPALVNPLQLKSLLDNIRVLNGGFLSGEVTMECNPRNVCSANLNTWADAGINRISLGVQTFQDLFLEKAGRRSSRKAILESLQLLKEHSQQFDLNIDLIQGLPGMSKDDQLSDLKEAVNWNPDHISWYSLIIEEGTVLSENWESRNGDTDVDNEDIWLRGCLFLEENGYNRYEISNFSHPGKESVHNCSYWRMQPYLGCGPAAVSMLRSSDGVIKRFKTKADAESYSMSQIEYDDIEVLSAVDFLKDYLLMGLRLTEGVKLRRFKDIFGSDLRDVLPETLKLWIHRDCLQIDNESLKCTLRGLDLLNSILISMFEEIDAEFKGSTPNWPWMEAVE